jgi:hypothetical protein
MSSRLLTCMLLALPLGAATTASAAEEKKTLRPAQQALDAQGRNPPAAALKSPPRCDIPGLNPHVACTDKLKAKGPAAKKTEAGDKAKGNVEMTYKVEKGEK